MTRHEEIIMDVFLCTRFNERAELVQRMRVKGNSALIGFCTYRKKKTIRRKTNETAHK